MFKLPRKKLTRPIACPPADPRQPQSFGYKCAWLAVKGEDTQTVARALGLREIREAGWPEGIACAYGESAQVFVTPPIEGWMLAAGSTAFASGERDLLDATRSLSSKLNREVFGFATNRVVEFHAWVCADGGRVGRAFGWFDAVLFDEGERRPAEASLDLNPEFPPINEGTVIGLAKAWSIDPTTFDSMPAGGLGVVGTR